MTRESFLTLLGAGSRAALTQKLVTRRYGEQETVISQADDTREVFVVLEGLARATLYSADGKMVAYRDVREGGIFGELSAIDGQPRSATVTAVTDLLVGRMSVNAFLDLVRGDGEFNMALLRYLAEQSRIMTERIFEFSTMLVRHRLVRELARLARAAMTGDNVATLDPSPTHFDLAARISTHREAVSREMSRLAKLGLIQRAGQKLVIHDVARLQE